MSFKSLGLSDALLRAISKKGYTTPSPIQAKAIPLVLERKDVLASAQTGTGKTAGFTLPMLQLLSQQPPLRRRPIRALILTPTRELAAQVFANVKEYSEFLDIRSTVIFGGVNAKPQIRTLRNGVDILVATPGRLLDLHSQKALSLAKVEMLVLDEADRMLDMGFLRDIKRVIELVPKRRQNLLFSATFSKDIKKLANSILHNPVSVEATPENTTAEKVNQKVYKVDKPQKTTLLIKLISDGNWSQVLVFTRTKHGANRLTKKLISKDISAAAIHGNKTQNARTKALSGFKKGAIRILVATDIAARGLDIPLLPHVINFELPNVPEDYVHRIGRTGRAGASGEAISLVSAEEYEYVQGIEKLLGEKLVTEEIEGFEVDPNYTPPPKQERPQRSRKKSNSSRKANSGGSQNNRNRSNSNSNSRNSKRKNSRSRNRRRD
ncbi:DEAD/DEAH box helicase [uncultured Kordia sp.]|uniref:DEAD/DEAH box helicase n=1 Tax=uncultured Kordia sp. TaxID=507699 RepID=UPI00262E3CA1|nr:DEAD/DEAH box helicase [uncultured Kordia sp.]